MLFGIIWRRLSRAYQWCLAQKHGHPSTFWKQTFVTGMGEWDHWYAQLHLLHIIPESMQPLHDLSHLEIIFQKALSHISMMLFVACRRLLGWSRACARHSWSAKGKYWSTKGWIIDWAVVEPPGDRVWAPGPVCCFQDIIGTNTSTSCCWGWWTLDWASTKDAHLNPR